MIDFTVNVANDNEAEDENSTTPLFKIDDVVYSIPNKPRPAIALKYLWSLKTYGDEAAAAQLLEDLLGKDGFAALVNYEDLTPEQFKQVMELAKETSLGGMETALGN